MQHERVAEQKKRDEAEAALAELAAERSKNRGRVQAHRFDRFGCNSAANSPAIPLQVPLQFRCWKSAQIRHKLLILQGWRHRMRRISGRREKFFPAQKR
jgi:hypothetical protein